MQKFRFRLTESSMAMARAQHERETAARRRNAKFGDLISIPATLALHLDDSEKAVDFLAVPYLCCRCQCTTDVGYPKHKEVCSFCFSMKLTPAIDGAEMQSVLAINAQRKRQWDNERNLARQNARHNADRRFRWSIELDRLRLLCDWFFRSTDGKCCIDAILWIFDWTGASIVSDKNRRAAIGSIFSRIRQKRLEADPNKASRTT